MDYLEGKTLRRRRAIGGGIAGTTAAAVVLASALIPSAANALDAAEPTDPSVAQGQIIQLPAALLGGLDIAALGHTITSNPSAPGAELGGLDADVLEALSIDVGTLNLPLLTDGTTPGLLQLGDLGSTQSFSSSPTQTQSTASSGTITSGGAIDTGAIDGSANPAQLELTDLFDQLAVAGLTDAVLDEASIGIGALASRADSTTGTVASEYRISDLGLDLHSNLVAGLASTLASTIQGALTPVSDLAGPGGALTDLVTTVVNTIDAIPDVPLIAAFEATGGTVSIAGLDTVGQTVANEVLLEPVENTTGSVLVDLSDGTITVDLARILVETGAGADLNSLPANTDVLSATTIAAIQQGITSALTGTHPNSLNGKVATILDTTLDSLVATLTVGVDLTNPLTGIDLVSGDVTIVGSLAQFAGTAAPAPTVTTDIALAGLNIGALLDPVVGAVTGAIAGTTGPLVETALTSVIPLLQPALAGITGPVLTALDPVLGGVLSGIADITINEQTTPGDILGDSFTVRALAVDLLPAVGGGVDLDFGSSTVKAALAAVALVDAAATVQAGTDLAVSGSGWPAATEVSVQLTAPGGGIVNDPVPVTTDANGSFTLGYFVPTASAPGAGYTVTATAGTTTATDTTEVLAAAAVDAAPAVQAGTDLAISGTNWPGSTQVTVQLTAPGGGAVGGPELVTTDPTGFFTLAYPVPAGTPAATGYTVTASVGAQTATDTTEVTDAPVPTVDAAPTVQAGTDLPVMGANWPANTQVTVQLTAPGGAAVGGPELVTTDATGGFTLPYPVPSSATPGTGYTVTATVGTQTATDTTAVTAAATVDAADSVQDGADLPVTGANWPANTQVTVQLSTPGGVAVGAPQLVTTGPLGAFSLDYPVPAGTPAGTGYVVTASVGTQTATDTTEVTDAPEVIDVAPSVPAGANLAVTGSGWAANATVSLQLTAPGGANVGGPVIATADGSGAFTANYPVPVDTAPGAGFTLTATSGTDTATDTTEVTAADPGDVNTNAAASASASADATADGDPSAQAAAEAAALADATSAASAAATADATAAAQAAATTDASTTASADVTSTANASAAVAAQAAAQADASDDANAAASTAAESNSAASSESAATTDSSTDASSEAAANANAAASASASADADASTAAVAEASAQAAAFSDATAEGSAAADVSAQAAAQTAATATSSTAATADATSEANAGAAIAAQAAALADATTDTAAEASATSDASTSAAANASAAAIATASTDASADAVAAADASAELNTNASASAAASAQADSDSNAAVEAAAVAAALADATSAASAAADVTADAAAAAAANDDASTDASTTATTDADASAAAAAQAAAQNDATSTSAADASASADADPNASAAAAANASSSATASATAAADASAEAAAEASASADAAADPDGGIAITVKVPTLERGERQTAVGTGFQPGEVVTGVMTSAPLALGTQVADAQGTVTFVWTIPADTDLGTHTVTLTGASSGSVAATFQVVASGLATTGGQIQGGWIALAALLLLLGLGAIRVARPRRSAVDTE